MHRTLLFIACSVLLACQSPHHKSDVSPEIDEHKANIWVRSNRLILASPKEIATAKQFESYFKTTQIDSKNNDLSVIFIKGILQNKGDQYSTTSKYEIRKSDTNQVLATIPSTIFEGIQQPTVQRVWVLDDGRILIYETWNDGAGPHDLYALAVPDEDKYKISYIDLPAFGIAAQEHGAIPTGIFDDCIIFDPLLGNRLYKINISDAPHCLPPLPFSIG